jgi:primary-amine oxidase
MPAEPMTLLLRPRNFFIKNPALDVPPSYCSTPSQVKNKAAVHDATDKTSKLVVGGGVLSEAGG